MIKFLISLILLTSTALAQTVGYNLPKGITKTQSFLFYLHGGIVTRQGNNAVNPSAPEWGPYEYFNILDSLKNHDFNVISEIRKDGR